MFAVIVTGPPGAGKTVTLIALSDALADAAVAHAAIDADEVAWAFPYPDLAQRCEYLRTIADAHRRAGHALLLVAEVIESPAHRADLLAALGAADQLIVRLDAAPQALRDRIIAREPPGWSGLEHLLGEAPHLRAALAELDGVDVVLDSERLALAEVVAAIRAARPDVLA